jgi:phage-related protein
VALAGSRPLVGAFGGGLYEVRTSLAGDIYRVFFCVTGDTMFLLHGFQKKTQKTPQREIDTARTRQKEVEGS